jgi:hypothetical protein
MARFVHRHRGDTFAECAGGRTGEVAGATAAGLAERSEPATATERIPMTSPNGPRPVAPRGAIGRLRALPESRTIVAMVLGGLGLLFAFTVLYVAAFHAPRAKGLDVGVVGPPGVAAQVQGRLDAADRGAFDVRRFAGEPAARRALLDTDIHGALVPAGGGARLLVAQALGPPQTLTVLAALRAAAPAPPVVEDLRPLPRGDRRGLSSLFTVIGTLMPSLVFGVLLAVFGGALPARARYGAIVAYALLAGPLVALDVDVVVGALDGAFVGVAVVSGLLALSVATVGHGLAHLGGPRGIAVAVLTLVLLGLSSCGGAVGYQFEPGFYGAVSQLLPPGAAVTAVRNVTYFDWAGTLGSFVVLGAWAVAGLALGLLGERYGHRARGVAAAPVLGIPTPASGVA